VDKASGAYFWYNTRDLSTQWVEVEQPSQDQDQDQVTAESTATATGSMRERSKSETSLSAPAVASVAAPAVASPAVAGVAVADGGTDSEEKTLVMSKSAVDVTHSNEVSMCLCNHDCMLILIIYLI
jgi:hypothetical protein